MGAILFFLLGEILNRYRIRCGLGGDNGGSGNASFFGRYGDQASTLYAAYESVTEGLGFKSGH